LLLGLGAWQLGGAAWMTGKAWLSQVLIAKAWGEVIAGGEARPPWPWADTRPVARLEVPALGLSRYVLADAGGTSLAFGPGFLPGSARPGHPGHTVLAGHRDSHFAFLEELEPGAELRLQSADGRWSRYRITRHQVIDLRKGAFRFDPGRDALTLVTCWPFGALDPKTPYRFLVKADALP
jgi:sortase A